MTTEFPSPAVTTAAAQQLWEYIYRTPWPEGWQVCWYDSFPPIKADALGATFRRLKVIALNWQLRDKDAPFYTLSHEFTHLLPQTCTTTTWSSSAWSTPHTRAWSENAG